MNFLLILVGWVLCIPAIILGPIAKLLPINPNRPWIDGLIINTLRAYKKYSAKSWIRRMVSIKQKPQMTMQFIKILMNKQKAVPIGRRMVDVQLLKHFHDVQIDHAHHRARVDCYTKNLPVKSDFGDIIVVDNVVHDGNHRLAAMREAGITYIEVRNWRTTE